MFEIVLFLFWTCCIGTGLGNGHGVFASVLNNLIVVDWMSFGTWVFGKTFGRGHYKQCFARTTRLGRT
jgi:hypothetical protein